MLTVGQAGHGPAPLRPSEIHRYGIHARSALISPIDKNLPESKAANEICSFAGASF
jgi:hypothetical protein